MFASSICLFVCEVAFLLLHFRRLKMHLNWIGRRVQFETVAKSEQDGGLYVLWRWMCTLVEHILKFIYLFVNMFIAEQYMCDRFGLRIYGTIQSECAYICASRGLFQIAGTWIAPCRFTNHTHTFLVHQFRGRASNVCRLRVRIDRVSIRNFPFALIFDAMPAAVRATELFLCCRLIYACIYAYNVGAHSVCQCFVASPVQQPIQMIS